MIRKCTTRAINQVGAITHKRRGKGKSPPGGLAKEKRDLLPPLKGQGALGDSLGGQVTEHPKVTFRNEIAVLFDLDSGQPLGKRTTEKKS